MYEEKIEALLLRMEENKQAMLEELQKWSPESLLTSPDKSSWNALQVLEHVLTSERGTLGYMTKKTASGWEGIPLVDERHHQESEKLNRALASEKRWTAPPVLPDPEGKHSLAQMAVDWTELREVLHRFVHKLDAHFLDRQIFRHPYSGMMSLGCALEFLDHHVSHHMHQLKRIASDLNSVQ